MPVASLRVLFSTLISCFSSNNSRRYYAVRIGRQGPRLYDNYPEFAAATLGLSGTSGKRFDNIHDAQEWLAGYLIPMASIQTSEYRIVKERPLAELGNLTFAFCLRPARYESQLERVRWNKRQCSNPDIQCSPTSIFQ
ncbi:hypothetical protein JVT61DRAFT_9308 [Boletus reticuloceps]|uniref:Ribonuclease H1 N-terminal domain-containing protein n=1 Tax=Boletus reticuloceps TaxID=495285 RepID=A0A8I3A605_9AGAM|nr:hypothetical protein JVT61DRAFT_9308 [Boletus reticuloceps]